LEDVHIFRTPEYKYIVHMRRYYYIDGISLVILMDLHVLHPTEYDKVVFGVPSACMYVHIPNA
jgi:hypothetical protein